MSKGRTLLFLLLVGLAACGEAPPREAAPAATEPTSAAPAPGDIDALLADEGYRSLPMRRLATGHLAVDGSADGTSFALIVDTGASHTILDRQRARRFRLALTEGRSQAVGVDVRGQTVATGVLRSVALGSLRLDSLPVSVLDLGTINQALRGAGAEAVDGIVGADFLSRKRAIIDYGATRLWLRDGNG